MKKGNTITNANYQSTLFYYATIHHSTKFMSFVDDIHVPHFPQSLVILIKWSVGVLL